MNLMFDLETVSVTEFGIGSDAGDGQVFSAIPVDAKVQTSLLEMVHATWRALVESPDGPSQYEPSEKHAATEYLYLSLDHEFATSMRGLHKAAALDIRTDVLNTPADVFCYFARLTDGERRQLTALRRASQFKGVLKSKNRLVRLYDDTLQVIEDTVFKLDNDFDLLIDEETVHILRPSGFEFAGKLQQAILDAVPENIRAIKEDLAFVQFEDIGTYAAKHPRAARYLASIRTHAQTKNVDKDLLVQFCHQNGIEITESKHRLSVVPGHELGFLEVLDRRRYEVNLVKETPELYRAGSRRKISD